MAKCYLQQGARPNQITVGYLMQLKFAQKVTESQGSKGQPQPQCHKSFPMQQGTTTAKMSQFMQSICLFHCCDLPHFKNESWICDSF